MLCIKMYLLYNIYYRLYSFNYIAIIFFISYLNINYLLNNIYIINDIFYILYNIYNILNNILYYI